LIDVRHEGRVARITLDRTDKRNALCMEHCRMLVDAFDKADADRSVGAILLQANGPTFCSGMDLKETIEIDQVRLAGIHERLFTMVQRLRTPLIAAVHGHALGGGTGLVANAHIVVASPEAVFGLTEIRIGLWPVLIFRAVEQAMGERRTVELSLTGREFSAAEAMNYGLVSEIADDAIARGFEIAKTIAGYSPVALGAGLDYVHQIRGEGWQHAGRLGKSTRDRLLSNDDFKEGVRAFVEKREPSWPSLRSNGH
jgi:enoyl-CoA hydratase/carnithine racemase